MKSKTMFYVLSFTWGSPMTLIGCIAALVMLLLGYTPHKWGGSYVFTIGQNWGGLDLGFIALVQENPGEHLKNHEFGHAVQNCYWGFLFPFVVAIPSAMRYWYREAVVRFGFKKYSELPGYYDIWFERQASELGQKHVKLWQ